MKKVICITTFILGVACISALAQTSKTAQKKPQTTKSTQKGSDSKNQKKKSVTNTPTQAEKDSLQIQDMNRYSKETYKDGSTNSYGYGSIADSSKQKTQRKNAEH